MTYAEFSESDYMQVEADNQRLIAELAASSTRAQMQMVEFMAVQIRIASLVEELVETTAVHPARFELRYETHLNQGLQALKAQSQTRHIDKPASGLILPGQP